MALDIPATLAWSEQTILGTCSAVKKNRDIQLEGIFHDSDLEFLCQLDSFSGSIPPPEGAIVNITQAQYLPSGENFYIDSIETDIAACRLMLKRTT